MECDGVIGVLFFHTLAGKGYKKDTDGRANGQTNLFMLSMKPKELWASYKFLLWISRVQK